MKSALNSLFSKVFLVACLSTFFWSAAPSLAQQKNLVATAVAAGDFDTLIAAVKAAGLADALSGGSQLTVFAPTDAAFAKLDPATLASLLEPANKEKLAAILTYHVVPGRVTASAAYGLRSANSLNGQRLRIDLQNDSPKINDSNLVATDIECSNGIIHVIDEVMLPAADSIAATASNAGIFNTLVAAVGAADLLSVVDGKDPLTVFAPTDEAFAALPAGTVESLLQPENKQKLIDILKFHVVSGRVYSDAAIKASSASTLLGRKVNFKFSAQGLKVNDANVIKANIETSNGVVHAIDQVLLPESSITPDEAVGLLTSAVHRGVPVFNSGHHKQCGDIYQTAMSTLMESGIAGADANTMSLISNTLSTANQSMCDTSRAWALRGGIDSLKHRLRTMQMQN